MHPLTDFLFLSPVFLGLYVGIPAEKSNLTLLGTWTPCIMGNPCF